MDGELPLAPHRKPFGQTVVYRLYDAEGRLLYVGITETLRTRLLQHAKDKAWWPTVAYRRIACHAGRAAAEREERQAILCESPVYNVVGSTGRSYPRHARTPGMREIGRASCRERVERGGVEEAVEQKKEERVVCRG